MRQRASWVLLWAAGLCAGAAPGCAHPGVDLLHGPAPEPPGTAVAAAPAEQRTVIPGFTGVRPSFSPPDAKASEAPPGPTVAVATQLPPALPPGQNVLEFKPAQPVLVPQSISDPTPPFQPLPLPMGQHTQPPSPPSAPSEERVVLALKALLEKKDDFDKAVAYLNGFDRHSRDVLMRLLPMVESLHRKGGAPLQTEEVNFLLAQLQLLQPILCAKTDLVIDTLCLCESIDGYGQYTPKRQGYAYKAGIVGRQGGERVNVYFEVKNLSSVPQGRYWTTRLNSTLSLRDGEGAVVWSYNYRNREQPLQSAEPHSDCYRNYYFFVPALPPGKYTLCLEVVDETCQQQRVARKSVEFPVAAP
jgi:hypothetical protein